MPLVEVVVQFYSSVPLLQIKRNVEERVCKICLQNIEQVRRRQHRCRNLTKIRKKHYNIVCSEEFIKS